MYGQAGDDPDVQRIRGGGKDIQYDGDEVSNAQAEGNEAEALQGIDRSNDDQVSRDRSRHDYDSMEEDHQEGCPSLDTLPVYDFYIYITFFYSFLNLYDTKLCFHVCISALLQQFSSAWEGKLVYLEAETTFGNQKRGTQTFLGYVQAPVDVEKDPEEIEEVRLGCRVILCTVQMEH